MNPQPARVLHVIDSLDLGGAQTFLLGLLPLIDESRFAIDVAAIHGPGLFSVEFDRIGFSPTHLARSRFDPRIPFRLRRLIRGENYDIVHAHLVPSSFLCEKFRLFLGIRRLITHVHSLYRRHRGYEYQNFLERRIYRASDLVVGCSKTVVDGVPTAVPARVLYNGVDATRFAPAEAEVRKEVRHELGLSEGDFVVGFTGRLVRVKNPMVLCRAAAKLREKVPSLKLLIVGSGTLEAELRGLVHKLGISDRVIFAGYQSAIERYLAAMDVFVIPSDFEGQGISLIEAMACRIPSVVADFEAAPEIITDGVEALQFARGNADSLAEQVLRYYEDESLRTRCAEAGRKRVLETFTAGHSSQRLMEIYRELLESPPGGERRR